MSVRKARVNRQTGNSTSDDGSEEMLMVSGVSRSHRGQVQLSLLRFDKRSRLQKLLLHAVHNMLEAYRITRRLGLPADTIYRKLPHLRSAQTEHGHQRVHVLPTMRAALEAKRLDARDRDSVARPKPVFKTHPPGFVEVVAANILLMWAAATIKF